MDDETRLILRPAITAAVHRVQKVKDPDDWPKHVRSLWKGALRAVLENMGAVKTLAVLKEAPRGEKGDPEWNNAGMAFNFTLEDFLHEIRLSHHRPSRRPLPTPKTKKMSKF